MRKKRCHYCLKEINEKPYFENELFYYCSRVCWKSHVLYVWEEEVGYEFAQPIDYRRVANPAKARELLQWSYDGLNRTDVALWVSGKSGVCKSRLLHRVQLRLMLKGWEVVWLASNQFHEQVVAMTAPRPHDDEGDSEPESIRDYMTKLRNADAIIFDDVAKLRLSQRVATEFHSLLDHRLAHRKPTFFSAAVKPETALRQGLADLYPERGPELLRRIREHCRPINLDRP